MGQYHKFHAYDLMSLTIFSKTISLSELRVGDLVLAPFWDGSTTAYYRARILQILDGKNRGIRVSSWSSLKDW